MGTAGTRFDPGCAEFSACGFHFMSDDEGFVLFDIIDPNNTSQSMWVIKRSLHQIRQSNNTGLYESHGNVLYQTPSSYKKFVGPDLDMLFEAKLFEAPQPNHSRSIKANITCDEATPLPFPKITAVKYTPV